MSKLSNKNRADRDYVELFLYTIEEYQRIVKDLPIDWSLSHLEVKLDKEYSAVNVRAMMLRKYINRGDNVWLGAITEKACNILPDKEKTIKTMYEEYVSSHNKQIEQSLENGTILNLRQTFEDIVYGTFLHADFERFDNLTIADESMKFYCIRQFVYLIENSALGFGKLFIDNDILAPTKKDKSLKAPVVALLESDKKHCKDIKGYWSNLYGRMDKDLSSAKLLIDSKSLEEKQILECTSSFLSKLEDTRTTVKDMENIIFQHSKCDWGDLSKARGFLGAIENPGIATTINYNSRKDVAYVKVLTNVESGFEIIQTQLVRAHYVTLIKDINEWRVFSFGGAIDPYIINK